MRRAGGLVATLLLGALPGAALCAQDETPGDAPPIHVVDELLSNPGMEHGAGGWYFGHAEPAPDLGRSGSDAVSQRKPPGVEGEYVGVSGFAPALAAGVRLRMQVHAMPLEERQRVRFAVRAIGLGDGASVTLADESDSARLALGEWTTLSLEFEVPEGTLSLGADFMTSSSTPMLFDDASLVVLGPRPKRDPSLAEGVELAGWQDTVGDAIAVVEGLRGHAFERPPAATIVDRTRFADHVAIVGERDGDAQRAHALQLLGVVPRGTDITAETRRLVREGAHAQWASWMRAAILTGDTPRAVVPGVLVHEFTHALDWESAAGAEGMRAGQPGDLDGVGVHQALTEGSACAVTHAYYAAEIDAGRMSDAVHELQIGSGLMGHVARRAEIGYLAVAAWMPYCAGRRFFAEGVAAHPDRSLSELIDEALFDPPRSVEQILHPAKYWERTEVDEPWRHDQLELAGLAPSGWTPSQEGTLGEALIAVMSGHSLPVADDVPAMLAVEWTHAPSEGWGGDAWRSFEAPGGLAVLLDTAWDSVDDAAEFEAALARGDARRVHRVRDRVLLVSADSSDDADTLMRSVLAALTAAQR